MKTMIKVSYHVAPRYTSGSPALVSQDIAERVAREEQRGYESALKGRYGADDLEIAQRKGLGWIAYSTWEQRGRYHRRDLITGETRSWRLRAGVPRIDQLAQEK